jgi:hypothetical protein
MKLDRKLNLVVPLERDTHTVYVHSAPISRAVFEQFHAVLRKSFNDIMADGLNVFSGISTALPALKDAAMSRGGNDEGERQRCWDAVEKGLMGEIRRISSVIVLSAQGGWETMPLHDAIKRKELDEEEAAEVESSIVFFTLLSRILPPDRSPMIMASAEKAGAWLLTPSNSTEFSASLPISTATATSETNRSQVPC